MTKTETDVPIILKEDEDWIRSRYNEDRLTNLGVLHCLGNSFHYNNQPVSKQLNMYKAIILDKWLAVSDLFYIKLNPKSVLFCTSSSYLNFCEEDDNYFISNKELSEGFQVQFTQEEVDQFLKDEPKGMWITEKVID